MHKDFINRICSHLVFKTCTILTLLISPVVLASHESPQKSGKLTHIIALRHGETNFNKANVTQGQVDNVVGAQLNEKGRAQAAQLGAWLFAHYPHINRTAYSSSLTRAKQTAEIVNAYFHHSLTIVNGDGNEEERVISDGLREIGYGPYDTTINATERTERCLKEYERMLEEFESTHPGENPDHYFYWRTNPLSKVFECPPMNENNAAQYHKNPETVLELFERGMASIRKIVELHKDQDRPIVIFGHGGIFATIIDECKYRNLSKPIPVHYFPDATKISNCGVCHFYYDHATGQLLFDKIEDIQ